MMMTMIDGDMGYEILYDRFRELTDDYAEKRLLKALAADIGISVTTVYNLRNESYTPTVGVLYRICKAFGVSSDWMLGLTDKE